MRTAFLASRSAFAAIALTMLASAGPPPAAGASSARVTVRIERSVTLRDGEVRRQDSTATGPMRERPMRERPCVEGDRPAGMQCRLLVTDIE